MADQNIYFEMFGACVDFGIQVYSSHPEPFDQYFGIEGKGWCHPKNPRLCNEEDMKSLFLKAL